MLKKEIIAKNEEVKIVQVKLNRKKQYAYLKAE